MTAPLRLFNSLTREIETFHPVHPGEARVYSRGPTVYTSFISTRSKAASHRDAFLAVTRALAKMQRWLYAHNGNDLAATVAPFFPDVPHELLARSLQRYLDADLWARETAMSRRGFERLGLSFLSGGSLRHAPVFENCVDLGLT